MTESFAEIVEKHGFDQPRCASGVGPGWLPIIDELLTALAGQPIQLDQVKEKFGSLRVYYHSTKDPEKHLATVDVLIRKAAKKAAETCEDCGLPGNLITKGWHRVLCKSCDTPRGT